MTGPLSTASLLLGAVAGFALGVLFARTQRTIRDYRGSRALTRAARGKALRSLPRTIGWGIAAVFLATVVVRAVFTADTPAPAEPTPTPAVSATR